MTLKALFSKNATVIGDDIIAIVSLYNHHPVPHRFPQVPAIESSSSSATARSRERKQWKSWNTWLEKDESLLHYVIRLVEEMLQDMKVYEAKLNEDSWNIPFLRQYLDEDTIRKIQAILPPTDSLEQDRKKWKFTQHGNFSVANAYKALKNDAGIKDWIWNSVWKWQGPEKIKCFTWMATYQKLLTAQRRARFLGLDSSCHRCKGVPETIQHVLRDCPTASRLWVRIIHHTHINFFFRAPFNIWLRWNLTTNAGIATSQETWKTQFLVSCWWL
ncbi:hypothetical protein AHAS_Ahas09G0101000 [Arachis hypogaea]